MTGLVSKATLMTVCGLVLAGAALAGVPNGSTSSYSLNAQGNSCVSLVGHNGSATDSHGEFSVTVRDVANNTVAGATVKIEFINCSRFVVAQQSNQHPYGAFAAPVVFVDATHRTVSQTTNASGVATFRIVGGSCNTGNQSDSGVGNCVQVFLDPGNTLKGTIKVLTYDQRDQNGMNAADISAFAADFFGAYHGRSDYDCNGSYGAIDISQFSGVFFGGQSTAVWTPAAGWLCP